MKKSWFISGLVCVLAFAQVSCGFDIGQYDVAGVDSGKAVNPSKSATAFKEVNFLDYAQPLVFGPSVGANNTVTVGPGGTASHRFGIVPEGWIELQATGGGGKIAGSEDGIAFYFKEVDASKNFILEADFLIKSFGTGASSDPLIAGTPEDTGLDANGQEGWGIMARDFIPQWGNGTAMDAILAKNLKLNTRNSGDYQVGNRGGDSNMIMVGGVKRGARVYWRWGVEWDKVTPLRRLNEDTGEYETNMESGNPTLNAYMVGNPQFYFLPREMGDYNSYTNKAGTPTLAARPDFPPWGSIYHIRLEKTNNGFDYLIRSPPEKGTPDYTTYGKDGNAKVPLRDILDSINKEKYYVGFFAARDACVWVNVESIKYSEANVDDCDPYVPVNPDEVSATLEVVSPEFYTGNDYLYVKSNVDGELVITQDKVRIPSEVIFKEWVTEKSNGVAIPHTMFIIPTLPHKTGANTFSMTFYPNKELPKEFRDSGPKGEDGRILKSTTPLTRTFVVTKKVYSGTIYVSPSGRQGNSGSRGSPLDLQTAINYVQPGQTIVMLNGTYNMKKLINIPRYNDGKFGIGNQKVLKAEKRNKVYIDFNKDSALEDVKGDYGFRLAGSYWVLDGFHVRNTPNKKKGVVIEGHNNVISYVMTYNNGDTGFQLSGSANEPKRYWPSGNTIQYCESFNNMDGAQTDADGFAAKLTVGKDNVFLWCISHNNNDDGWDLFTKKETGPTGIVKFFGCVSYDNRTLLNGHQSLRGAGNGFKLGGEGIPIRHEVRQCLSFANNASPIMSNSNPSIDIFNSTAIDSSGTGAGGISITSGDKSTPNGTRINCWYSGTPTPPSPFVTNNNYQSVMHTLKELYGITDAVGFDRSNNRYDISDTAKFLDRKPDGRPDLGDVYKPNTTAKTDGAWVFYVDDDDPLLNDPKSQFVNY